MPNQNTTTQKGQLTNRQYGIEMELNIPYNRDAEGNARFRSHSDIARYLSTETGIEVVAEGYNHRTRDYWKIVSDSSINGEGIPMELVSPPLSGMGGFVKLEAICTALNAVGATINTSHGIHVHQDLNDWKRSVRNAELSASKRKLNLNINKVSNLLDLVARYEPALWAMHPKSRIGSTGDGGFNTWSFGNGSMTYPSYYRMNNTMLRYYDGPNHKRAAKHNIKRFLTSQGNSSLNSRRHVGLNFQSYWRYGTVEFRMAAGSANYAKIKNWIVITQAIVETAGRKAEQGRRVLYNHSKAIRFDAIGKLMRSFKTMVGLTMTGPDVRAGNYCDNHHEEAAEFMTRRVRKNGRNRSFGSRWLVGVQFEQDNS